MSDSETPETRHERFTRQTKEQYELVGRFVQEFEFISLQCRSTCMLLLVPGPHQHLMLQILLHNSSLTAFPLFEVTRAILAEFLKRIAGQIPKEDREFIETVLSQSELEFRSLNTTRNDLLHGTWMTGWGRLTEEDYSELRVFKYKPNKSGFATAKTPANTKELRELLVRCNNLRNVLAVLTFSIIDRADGTTKDQFIQRDKRWFPKRPIYPLAPSS